MPFRHQEDESREAAEEYSPRRKPWVLGGTQPSPEGVKEKLRYSFRATANLTHYHY
jgi:hypothetical protein